MRLTRCDVCTKEMPFGDAGYRVEKCGHLMSADHSWDCCSLKCVTDLTATLTARDEERGQV